MKQTQTVKSIKRILASWKRAKVGRFNYFIFWTVLSLFSWIVIPGIIAQWIELRINKRKNERN